MPGVPALHGNSTLIQTVGAPGAAAFQHGWTNFGGGWQFCQYWKDANGLCHLRGLVTGGPGGFFAGAAVAIFKLPVGFRLGATERFVAAAYPGGIKGSPLTIPELPLLASGTDSNNDTVAVSGKTGKTDLAPPLAAPVLGSTWVDVGTDGTVLAWMDATTSGYFVSLSGISYYSDR